MTKIPSLKCLHCSSTQVYLDKGVTTCDYCYNKVGVKEEHIGYRKWGEYGWEDTPGRIVYQRERKRRKKKSGGGPLGLDLLKD